jgi:hypothetical protein
MREKQPTADEVFVNLLRASREDEKIKKFLNVVVDLDDFERKSLINSFISEMALKGAPSEFIQAIAALRDRDLIREVRQWLASS